MDIRMHRVVAIAALAVTLGTTSVSAQTVLYEFTFVPVGSTLPLDTPQGGIMAHFSGTGQGYTIEDHSSVPGVPAGLPGHFIYPTGTTAADLIVSFDQTLTYFGINYAPQEVGCTDSATMRLTASMNGNFVGTTTRTASNPGTQPVATINCNFPQGFNSVVVHYDSPPTTCQSSAPIFMADDMRVLAVTNGVAAFCFGDGSGLTCPCGLVSLPARGCGNTKQGVFGSGAHLSATGVPSLSSDTLVLRTTGTMAGTTGVYFQGSAPIAAIFGNGIHCAAGVMYRLENSLSMLPGDLSSTTVPIHVFGHITLPGTVSYYQGWYRDVGNVGTCTPGAGFNMTNALTLTWLP